jgi:hypothetical protein
MEHRRYFLDKNLLYLCSLDANLEYGREDIGVVPGGIRVNVSSVPEDSRVYNVTGETFVLGEKVISGTVKWGCDWALARKDDVELMDVRLIIQTDDGAAIEGEVVGILAPGPRTFRHVLTERPKLGSEQQPAELKIFVAPRFRSGHVKYRWLNDRQCLAFGRIKFIDSVARQSTLDVWLMD